MNKLVMKRKAKKAADYFFTYLLLIVIGTIYLVITVFVKNRSQYLQSPF